MDQARVDEICDGIFRLNHAVATPAGDFSFNQYLIVDEQPLLFHTGPRRLFAAVRDAVARVLPVDRLRFVAFSHYESDECGGLDGLLAAAPEAVPLCSAVNLMINGDTFARPARALADGELLTLGRHRLRWFDTPHLPHAWECGYLMEEQTRTLLCGDLFTQAGAGATPLLRSTDLVGASEAMRRQLDYFSHSRMAPAQLERLAATQPTTLACMHGSAWTGDGAALLRALGDAFARDPGP